MGVLSEVWVLMDGVPPLMRGNASIMAFSELIGIPREVDEQSLAQVGAVRVRIASPAPERLFGAIPIFPSAKDFSIRIRVEGASAPVPPSCQPPPPAPAI